MPSQTYFFVNFKIEPLSLFVHNANKKA